MRHPTHRLAVVLALAACHSSVVQALEPSPYRLKLDDSVAYRLKIGVPERIRGAPIVAPLPFAREIEIAARDAGIEPALIHAVVSVESGYRPTALSPKGAVGLMQVMPATARRFGIERIDDPANNLAAGTRYLRTLLNMFDQRMELALAAYNAGEGAVIRHSGIPPYPETQRYVPAVMAKLAEFSPSFSAPASPKQQITRIQYIQNSPSREPLHSAITTRLTPPDQ